MDPNRRKNSPSPIEQPNSGALLYSSATDEESDDFQEGAVGKSSGRRVNAGSLDDSSSTRPLFKDAEKEPVRVGRPRSQSTYGRPTAPSMPRMRSRSTAGTNLEMNGDLNGSSTGLNKFVDPLLMGKQETEKETQQNAALTKPMVVVVVVFSPLSCRYHHPCVSLLVSPFEHFTIVTSSLSVLVYHILLCVVPLSADFA